ncbi:hypothetical protein [Chromobacterium rhizoryzae]|uniref:hypothetical protein n=1 Tax=Chromobacterium rhizoryzae TaxID=1778675 RepID=UPI001D08A12F|nr:hypothetical protein [Chromobacterium rhizoryzae]
MTGDGNFLTPEGMRVDIETSAAETLRILNQNFPWAPNLQFDLMAFRECWNFATARIGWLWLQTQRELQFHLNWKAGRAGFLQATLCALNSLAIYEARTSSSWTVYGAAFTSALANFFAYYDKGPSKRSKKKFFGMLLVSAGYAFLSYAGSNAYQFLLAYDSIAFSICVILVGHHLAIRG